jgi:hypothetical protein
MYSITVSAFAVWAYKSEAGYGAAVGFSHEHRAQ